MRLCGALDRLNSRSLKQAITTFKSIQDAWSPNDVVVNFLTDWLKSSFDPVGLKSGFDQAGRLLLEAESPWVAALEYEASSRNAVAQQA
jgi:hypothetical protein